MRVRTTTKPTTAINPATRMLFGIPFDFGIGHRGSSRAVDAVLRHTPLISAMSLAADAEIPKEREQVTNKI